MNVHIVLYDDFNLTDAFGTAAVFAEMPGSFYVTFCSVKGGIINGNGGIKVWTEYLLWEEVEDIIVIPGGKGVEKMLKTDPEAVNVIKRAVEESDRCLMVGNGAEIVASTGLLFHRNIADYVGNGGWKQIYTAGIKKVPEARWIVDGKYYSCSNSMNGIAMALGAAADATDVDIAQKAADRLGYQINLTEENEWRL